MRSLVVALMMLAVPAILAQPVGAHRWYTGLRSPSGELCCDERDCRPVEYRINHDTGREEIRANGAWYPVEYDKVLPFSSPDSGYHACWGNAVGRPHFRCIILPGMATLDNTIGRPAALEIGREPSALSASLKPQSQPPHETATRYLTTVDMA
jgi:hypothetical protein